MSLVPCALEAIITLADAGVLRENLLAEFRSLAISAWQKYDSFYDFLSAEGVGLLTREVQSAELDHLCRYSCNMSICTISFPLNYGSNFFLTQLKRSGRLVIIYCMIPRKEKVIFSNSKLNHVVHIFTDVVQCGRQNNFVKKRKKILRRAVHCEKK